VKRETSELGDMAGLASQKWYCNHTILEKSSKKSNISYDSSDWKPVRCSYYQPEGSTSIYWFYSRRYKTKYTYIVDGYISVPSKLENCIRKFQGPAQKNFINIIKANILKNRAVIKQYILIDGNIFGLDSWALKNYKIVHQKSDPDDKLPDIKYQQ